MAQKKRPRGQMFTVDEILHLVQVVHHKHGEPLSFQRFFRHSEVPGWQIYHHFRSWHDVREAAGLPRKAPCTRRIPEARLMSLFHQVVTHLKRYPTPAEFEQISKFSYQLLWRRIGTWSAVRQRYKEWLDREWSQAFPDERQTRNLNPQQLSHPSRDVVWLRNTWLGLRVGFELQSRHFEGRNPCECDLLIVLKHDWLQCPVPVLELTTVMPELE